MARGLLPWANKAGSGLFGLGPILADLGPVIGPICNLFITGNFSNVINIGRF